MSGTEVRLSELYATKGMTRHTRVLVRDLLDVVSDNNSLTGFSWTIAACAIIYLAGTAYVKHSLTRAAVQEMSLHWDAILAALQVLRSKWETLEAVIEQADRQESGEWETK
jgi:hypothetical protein